MMDDYSIKRIDAQVAKEYIHQHHYSHGSMQSPSPCYGLYSGEILVGAAMFATPISEDVRRSVFGKEHVDRVKELHRLHILDVTPRNTESWFLSRILKKLRIDRPDIWAVLSFSDTTYGHTGVIYQATNAYRLGTSHGRTAYMDQEGRLRSCHQKGTYLKKVDAEKMGWKVVWTKKKYKYLWLLPHSKAHKKELISLCRYDLTSQKFH